MTVREPTDSWKEGEVEDEPRSIDVERVEAEALSAEDFVEHYVKPSRPVVLTGLFAGQPIAELDDEQKAIEKLGDVEFPVSTQYSDSMSELLLKFFRGQSVRSSVKTDSKITLEEYLTDTPDERLYLHEAETPPQVERLYDKPEYCNPVHYPWWTEGPDASDEARNGVDMTFIAKQGRYADLHCHDDIAEVLLYQVFGRKEVVLIPPSETSTVAPIMELSPFDLSAMDERKREYFARMTGGYQDVLQPGETLYLPATWWHFLYYIDDAMSVNWRFGAPDDPDVTYLARVSRDPRHKRIAYELRDEALRERFRPRIRELKRLLSKPWYSAHRKESYLTEKTEEWYEELFPGEKSVTHAELNDVFSTLGALAIDELSMPRRAVVDLFRRLGYKIARLG